MHAIKTVLLAVGFAAHLCTKPLMLPTTAVPYKDEIRTIAVASACTAGLIAASYILRAIKNPELAYKNALAEFNTLASQTINSGNDIKTHKHLEHLLHNAQACHAETIGAFNRLIVLHKLYDAKTQKKAYAYLEERMWAATAKLGAYFIGSGLTGRYAGPNSVELDGNRDIEYERTLLTESIVSAWILEPPAHIMSAIYTKYFANKQKLQEQKENILLLANSFRALVEKEKAFIRQIKEQLEKIETSQEYRQAQAAYAALPWWEKIIA